MEVILLSTFISSLIRKSPSKKQTAAPKWAIRENLVKGLLRKVLTGYREITWRWRRTPRGRGSAVSPGPGKWTAGGQPERPGRRAQGQGARAGGTGGRQSEAGPEGGSRGKERPASSLARSPMPRLPWVLSPSAGQGHGAGWGGAASQCAGARGGQPSAGLEGRLPLTLPQGGPCCLGTTPGRPEAVQQDGKASGGRKAQPFSPVSSVCTISRKVC